MDAAYPTKPSEGYGEKDLPPTPVVFTVGARTGSCLRLPWRVVVGGEGSASALVPHILQYIGGVAKSAAAQGGGKQPSPPPPALFVCGDRRLDTIPAALQGAAFPCLEVPVYRTLPAPAQSIKDSWDAACLAHVEGRPGPPGAIVVFSPSGVEAAIEAGVLGGEGREGGVNSRPILIAIGPTTALAMKEAGFPPSATAPTPTPQGILEALKHSTSCT